MAAPSSIFAGMLGARRGLGDGLLVVLGRRPQLVALELHEEKMQLMRIRLWLGAIIGVGLLGLVFVSRTIVQLYGPEARFAALGGVALSHVGALLVFVCTFRRYLASRPLPFAATLEELRKDRACIRKLS